MEKKSTFEEVVKADRLDHLGILLLVDRVLEFKRQRVELSGQLSDVLFAQRRFSWEVPVPVNLKAKKLKQQLREKLIWYEAQREARMETSGHQLPPNKDLQMWWSVAMEE